MSRLSQKTVSRISRSLRFTEALDTTTPQVYKTYRHRLPKQLIKAGITAELISAGGSGDVTIYRKGVETDPVETVEAYLDWVHGEDPDTMDISQDTKVILYYFRDEQRWRIISADCEPEPAPAPPGHGNDIDLTSESAGTTQGSAYGLSFKSNRITVATGSDNAVKLPSSFDQEAYCHVRNDDAADSIQVFPVSGGFINNQAVNTAETIAAGAGLIYTQVQSDHWISS